MTIYPLRHARKAGSDPFRYFRCLVAADVDQNCSELLTTHAADQIRSPHRLARGLCENGEHAVADRVAKAIIDRLEMIKVDQQHRGRPRIADMAFGDQRGILQERAAVGDAGEWIHHRSSAMAQFDDGHCVEYRLVSQSPVLLGFPTAASLSRATVLWPVLGSLGPKLGPRLTAGQSVTLFTFPLPAVS